MAESYTTNYQFVKYDRSDVGWDVGLNGNWDALDTLLKGLETEDASLLSTIQTHEAAANPHGTGVSDLSDVYVGTGPTEGQVLKWNATNARWELGIIEPPESLDDLGDVDATTPADGDVLVWVDAQGAWVPSAAGGGGATVLGGLTDVDLATNPPTEGQALVFDATAGEWIPGTVQTQIDSIGDIADVTVPEPASLTGGEILVWNTNTEKWEAGYPAALEAPPVQIQIGVATVPGSGSQAVAFPQAFAGAPSVALGPESAGSPYIDAGTVTSSGFTLVNPETANINVHWIAIYGATGGGSGTIVTGEGLPIDAGGQILTIPEMPE
jgi:hypothetical protein